MSTLCVASRLALAGLLPFAACVLPAPTPAVDVCVYGATSAGVIAAVQAAREGRAVVLIDCDGHIGGMTTAGLSATDIGNPDAIGGLAREFYRSVRTHYDQDAAWTAEPRARFRGHGHPAGSDVAWTFEPHVASAWFADQLARHGIAPRAGRLDRDGGVHRHGQRITAIALESGERIAARVFLDCTYEGDLLAAAGCSYMVGREDNAEFGETLNGVQTARADKHQFAVAVEPWLRSGDPASGLLPGIEVEPVAPDGSADARVQAYCYRICASTAADRLPWPRPADYDETAFELLLRWFDAGARLPPWHPLPIPNKKTDSNNNGPVSTDGIGMAWQWAAASYDERAQMAAQQRRWQQGLLWTLANHPRVPLAVREHFQAHGLPRDEFAATGHWPPVLYVREARRLRAEVVVTERQCTGALVEPDPVGLGAYAMDSHHVRRHVALGAVRNEGDVQVRVGQPYGIPYRALVPYRGECDNLLVPVCLSATHIAFGSIRMEPVFMVLAQSAAIAAGLAFEADLAVQDVPYALLAARLRAAGQVCAWPPVSALPGAR